MVKIISDGFPEGEEVLVEKISVTYMQLPDCESGEEDYQSLTLETRDGGGGKFINFKTENTGWSISDENDLIPVVKHFRKFYENSDNS